MNNEISHHQNLVYLWDGTLVHYQSWCHSDVMNAIFLLLHDLDNDSHSWDVLAPELAEVAKVAIEAPDQRGHSSTDNASNVFTFDQFQDDFETFVDFLIIGPSDKPVIVGLGWGGLTGLAFAARHPELVHGLVLIDYPTPESHLPSRFAQGWKEQAFNISDLAAKVRCPVLLIGSNQIAARIATKQLAKALHNSSKVVAAEFDILEGDILTQHAVELAELIAGFFSE